MSRQEFDFIVVGAGSAGCAVAARLSEDAATSVLLIEAGGQDGTPLFTVPGAQVFLKDWTRYAWLYDCQPDASRLNRPDQWRRGRILGGSSTINGLMRFSSPHCLVPDLLRAFANAGVDVVDDINLTDTAAVGLVQTNQYRGLRQSASAAYLAPARHRPNLDIWTDCRADHILFDGRRAVGVAVRRAGVVIKARARREVVVSTGAIASPLLLMRSGIGPAAWLQQAGLPVRVDAPDVGCHLQEHPELYVEYEVRQPTYTRHRHPAHLAAIGLQWALARKGPATSPGSHILGYAHSGLAPSDPPDLLMFAGPWGRLEDAQTFTRGTPVFSLSPSVARPRSRGRVKPTGPSADDPPRIEPHLLADPHDVRTLMAGVRLADRIASQAPFAQYVHRRLTPAVALDDEVELERFVREDASICYHACGTCRMGGDSDAVVDGELRVRGVAGLRVADTSVMPAIPSGNLNAPASMIGERAADFIRKAML